MNNQHGRHARLRNTATGALAAFAAVGAIAGTAAVAAQSRANTPGHAAAASSGAAKTPTPPVPGKTHTSQPGSSQPFVTAVQRLVDAGTITTTEARAVDREILAGSVDPQTLTSSGFTPTQLQAVEQTLDNAKRALAPGVTGVSKPPKEPPPAGTGAPGGGKQPPPAAPASDSTPR